MPEDGSRDDEPLSDLREDVERRRERDGEDAFEELFADVDTDEVDDEDVWEDLSASEEASLFAEPDVAAAVAADDDGTEQSPSPSSSLSSSPSPDAGGRDVRVVEKRLCHQCPHFADPPETACTHDGTTIDAEVDTDHFRVVDCPVVAARENRQASDFSADEP